MKPFNARNAINTRLLVEISISGLLAFIIVSAVVSATSPAPLSLGYLMTLA